MSTWAMFGARPRSATTQPAAVPVRRPPEDPLPRWPFVAVALGSAGLLVALCWRVFLFWDDFVFLGQARGSGLERSYLTEPLFNHFSPVTRAVNWLFVGHLAAHPWLVRAFVCALVVATVFISVWWLVVVFGRTWPALAGSVLLAPSLTLIPLGNWWTAAANILPALIGFGAAFSAFVLVVRGRSRWWAVVCWLGAGVGVLDYELPMLLFGYLGLWLLLFRDRVTDRSLGAVLRRTWWVYLGLVAICGAAILNYRFNYYEKVDRPGLDELLHAMVRSLVRTLVPTLVGFHDPRTSWFSTLSLVVGWVVLLVVVGWLLLTRRQAWRGLLFAAAGWALPTLALALNRVSLFGVTVVDNIIYFYLPTALFLIGLLEAHRGPVRGRPRGVDPRLVRVAVPALAVVVVAAYAWSVGPSQRYQLPPGTGPQFVERARESAARIDGSFSVVNDDVPGSVVPEMFHPYNRADVVLGLTVPEHLAFDVPQEPYYRLDERGDLVPVSLRVVSEVVPSPSTMGDQVRLLNVTDRSFGDNGLCFRTTSGTQLVWRLPDPVSGDDLVLRALTKAQRQTPVVAAVAPDPDGTYVQANLDQHVWGPHRPGGLDTVEAQTVGVLKYVRFTPGVRVCVSSLAVAHVTDAS